MYYCSRVRRIGPNSEAAMRRIGSILLIVLSFSLLTPSLAVLAAQATPTGDPASKEVEANVGKFFNVVINRINRHDRRGFDPKDQDPVVFLFGPAHTKAHGLFGQSYQRSWSSSMMSRSDPTEQSRPLSAFPVSWSSRDISPTISRSPRMERATELRICSSATRSFPPMRR